MLPRKVTTFQDYFCSDFHHGGFVLNSSSSMKLNSCRFSLLLSNEILLVFKLHELILQSSRHC